MDLHYEANFKKNDLVDSIFKSLKNQFPELSSSEVQQMAINSLEYIETQGNSILYRGLVNEGVKHAKNIYSSKKDLSKKLAN